MIISGCMLKRDSEAQHQADLILRAVLEETLLSVPACVHKQGTTMGIWWVQGDGEVSFCGAIEMSGWLELK